MFQDFEFIDINMRPLADAPHTNMVDDEDYLSDDIISGGGSGREDTTTSKPIYTTSRIPVGTDAPRPGDKPGRPTS